MRNNKKTAATKASRTKKSGNPASKKPNTSIREDILASYEDAKLANYAASVGVPGVSEMDADIVGSTTHIDANGKVKNKWVRRTYGQNSRREMFVQAIQAALSATKPAPRVKMLPGRRDKDLLAVYPLGDPHVGLYAWEQETGQPFDLEICKEIMKTAIDDLVERAPNAEQALLVNLGDFFHADNHQNRTERSGHVLDVDTRRPKVFRIGIEIMIYAIEACLRKHRHVRVINEIGNHDVASSMDLMEVLKHHFIRNPRVEFDDSPQKFHFYKFGKTLIGTTHGDMVKMKDLPGIMATDRPKDWGDTEYRYWLIGHVHHHKSEEFPGVVVEYFRTLAARDAWHHSSGYRSGRDQQVWTVDRNYGVIRKEIADIARIRDLIEARLSNRKSRRKAA